MKYIIIAAFFLPFSTMADDFAKMERVCTVDGKEYDFRTLRIKAEDASTAEERKMWERRERECIRQLQERRIPTKK